MQTRYIQQTRYTSQWCTRLILFIGCFLYAGVLFSQDLDYASHMDVHLNDGTVVRLYAQAAGFGISTRPGKNYYYLPPEIMLAKNPQTQVPQFLFLKYTTEQRENQGGVTGALLHFLVQWGITPGQLSELQVKLAALVPGAVVKGAVQLFPADGDSYVITSATVNEKSGTTRSLLASGKAPLLENDKLAVAANLNATGAQLLAATFEKTKSVTDLSVTLAYKYYAKINGLKAKIVIDYSKIASLLKYDQKDSKKDVEYNWSLTGGSHSTRQTWQEIHGLIDKLQESQAVSVVIDQNISNNTSDKIAEMVFQILLAKLTVAVQDTGSVGSSAQQAGDSYQGEQKGTSYHFSNSFYHMMDHRKKDSITVDYNYALPLQAQITGNLASWYNSVKDNKNCIATVNLNDPFYKHQTVYFQLEMESGDLFDQAINFVTVKVRKKRQTGNDFTGTLTFTKKSVADSGIMASLTYAGGDDRNPDLYQYMTQWSLRGGGLYPENPVWEKGQLETVSLKPPVTPRTIEFETDIEKLKASGISRVTLQLRYKKFNEEMEDNINIPVVKNEPLVSKTVFMDRDAKGYAYRLVFNHTVSGKLALPWSVKVNDNYVYAVIPAELADSSSQAFSKAVDAGKNAAPAGADGKVTTDKVLDSFKEVLGTTKTAQ